MTADEQQVRGLIERWAAAVHDGDMATVLALHAPEILMFDVPPPEQGVRGLDAYRETWPRFFRWQASGAVFEIESLDVTAGMDVAFAVALQRCSTPADLARDPAHRLRLTIGLRKEDDRWVVTHEHHSFPGDRREGVRVGKGCASRGQNVILATNEPRQGLRRSRWGTMRSQRRRCRPWGRRVVLLRHDDHRQEGTRTCRSEC